ncbi:DUF3899 domain-containing protein [Carnobacterium inhibens]|uniref:Tryptophanyl-tRNA synthetase n=2 Tax=Carnobacterium inhibens TaxID=147709 RepID=U5SBX0_9LACT|nr:DUF3899 domain-containing protein [Carnobacterium inhibens]AGY81332.1 tryptophanyl-tRNA synthetase [Carnobacterium inhibens subsp. gilichinskyi]MBC9825160.1 DUF3899 domain-containing protein [Carnobacterium inhibens]
MKQKFTPIRVFMIVIVLCVLLELIMYKEISFYHTTNITFYGASFFLIIGLFGASLSSGFFDFFHFSMRKAAFNIRKGRHSDDEFHVKPLSKVVGNGFSFYLKVGSGLLLVCILTLIAFYLFER